MIRPLRATLSTIAAVVLATALAACGDDAPAADAPPSDAPATAAASAAGSEGAGSEDAGSEDAGSEGAGGATDGCPPADGTAERVEQFDAAPPMCIDVSRAYQAVVTTNLGEFTIDLDTEAAPNAVNNFVVLARSHFYDDTPCHRIIPAFMAQCGDPTGSGSGGPGYEFADELPADSSAYTFGSVAMANAGPNTQGSQFFTVTAPEGYPLEPNYTVFGQVTDSKDNTATLTAIDAVGNPGSNGVPPLEPVTVESITITES